MILKFMNNMTIGQALVLDYLIQAAVFVRNRDLKAKVKVHFLRVNKILIQSKLIFQIQKKYQKYRFSEVLLIFIINQCDFHQFKMKIGKLI